MCDIDYSAVIRTTGESNEKYISLLKSIDNLIPKPKEILIVLPNGYSEPEYKLGWETFYYTEKGMVSQRLYGIEKCKTKYALVTDDDISFDSDFVCKLYEPIKNGMCKLSAGPLYSFFPSKGVNTLICSLMGSAVPTLFHKNYYCKLLRTTGYSYNRNLDKNKKYYEAQSLAWTCFFGETESLNKIDMRSEIWLDKNGYASHDDTTMFYKASLMGIKTIVVEDAIYNHLDAKTSTKNNDRAVNYSIGFNRVVFWHRFIYTMQSNLLKKLWANICFKYSTAWLLCYEHLCCLLKKKHIDNYINLREGNKAAHLYLKSDEYRALPEFL